MTELLSQLQKQQEELVAKLSPEERAIFNQFQQKKNAIVAEMTSAEMPSFELMNELNIKLMNLQKEYATSSNK